MSNSKVIKIDSLSLQNMLDEDSELIPLMTAEDEEEINCLKDMMLNGRQSPGGTSYAGGKS